MHVTDDGGKTIVRVSGSLTAAGVPLLRDVLLSDGRRAIFDLADLVSTTVEGIAALRALRASGHELRNASPYVALRLQESDDGEASPDRPGPNAGEAPTDEGERT